MLLSSLREKTVECLSAQTGGSLNAASGFRPIAGAAKEVRNGSFCCSFCVCTLEHEVLWTCFIEYDA